MSNNLIEFQNVSFRYSSAASLIISGLGFMIEKGERVALKGESGSGKTTLFRLLLGFEVPETGNIFYNKRPLNKQVINQIRKDSAWLPQDLNLGQGKVEKLMDFPFRFKANSNHAPDSSEKLAAFCDVGLQEELLDKNYAELSTGQRQRVGLVTCHLLQKPLLLLDEPTSALDPASKQKAAHLIFNAPDRTVVSTSHDEWWLTQCNRVIELGN